MICAKVFRNPVPTPKLIRNHVAEFYRQRENASGTLAPIARMGQYIVSQNRMRHLYKKNPPTARRKRVRENPLQVLHIDTDGSQTEGIPSKCAISDASGSIKRGGMSRTIELERNSSRAKAYVRDDAPLSRSLSLSLSLSLSQKMDKSKGHRSQ